MKSIVLTTINRPTESVHRLLDALEDWKLVVIGDRNTPTPWEVDGATFLGIDQQQSNEFALAKLLPENHYCRKNLGYLHAIQQGAQKIAETDDDNYPTMWALDEVEPTFSGDAVMDRSWVNIYRCFTDERVWARGLPLEQINWSYQPTLKQVKDWKAPVHQFLAEGDPDVDAIYRLTVGKADHSFRAGSVALGIGAITPFNSQSTLWFPEAFPYMYLPSHVSFRMTDIWRSYVAQVCMWARGQHLVYHGTGVRQERNVHNLLKDFGDEVVGFQRNAEIMERLQALDLKTGEQAPTANLWSCYVCLNEMKVVPDVELNLLAAWIDDITLLRKSAAKDVPTRDAAAISS